MAVIVRWFGHSAFSIEFGNKTILIDPFLTGNPLNTTDPESLKADLILVSHAHGDHVGDSAAIAHRTGALVACNFEMGNWYIANGIENVIQGNTGGWYQGEFIDIKWTIAFHSSSFPDGTYGGQPNGFIIRVDGKVIYFAGDTALFGDMSLIGDEGIDLAFLPIGDFFTMGIEDSIKATKLIRPKYVIPMHYNTFPPIVCDAGHWADMVNRNTDAQPIVLDPGTTFTLD
jgi:L-ascorbate metabolism protein UlaG (beta-lactamase superfamily)